MFCRQHEQIMTEYELFEQFLYRSASAAAGELIKVHLGRKHYLWPRCV